MASGIGIFCGLRFSTRHRALPACAALLFALGRFALLPVLADGCFVFRWNKKVDINEPTQKAIIVHDAGREDLLLQVKYEGPLEEFGWLIPVPALPTVEHGSMQPFYELSKLTQHRFGAGGLATMSASTRGGGEEAVRVIEIKTVGAYEVAVLSAQDAGSLARWLQANGYLVPKEKSGITDEYIRKGWYFIAAKIRLDKGVAFRMASGAGPKDSAAPVEARNVIQRQLSSGELHPLLISFDTPVCIFPLRISAVGGKPSEVSIYVLSAEPLLNGFIFDKECERLDRLRVEWEEARPQREEDRETSMRNLRSLSLAHLMYSFDNVGGNPQKRRPVRDWSVEDLVAIGKEIQPSSPKTLHDDFYASPEELLQCMRVTPDQMTKCAKELPRLKKRPWYLTKQVWTFAPEEMHDLRFEPAMPAVARALRRPTGAIAAALLSQFGSDAGPVLAAACKSADTATRINAATSMELLQDERSIEPLLKLLADPTPQVRLHAARAASPNWDRRFVDLLMALFRDSHPEIRWEASQSLCAHEVAANSPVYVGLLTDSDPRVRVCALRVLLRINPDAIPPATVSAMLKERDEDIQSSMLDVASRMKREVIPRADLLPLLGSTRMEIVNRTLNLLHRWRSRSGPVQSGRPEAIAPERQEKGLLSSAEAAPLTTNQLTLARLMGLKVLRQNADADAIDLALPLLRDTNSLVRNRALALLRTVSGQNTVENDPAKWEQWWTTNRATFKERSGTEVIRLTPDATRSGP